MSKEYQKPDLEYICLIVEETITTEDEDEVDGVVGVASSIF